MKRIEVMISQAIAVDFEENYLKECKKLGIECKFTKIENVMGQGNSNPKLGNSIWPQLNSMYVVYCEDDVAEKVRLVISDLNKSYPGEGAAAFVSDGSVLV
ncbi:MAG: hypothetical protein K6G52_07580 [Treponemataceae bacterium]|nr:hypothetical protein [Treponemataceae bacterium]